MHIAARIAALAQGGQVLVRRAVRDQHAGRGSDGSRHAWNGPLNLRAWIPSSKATVREGLWILNLTIAVAQTSRGRLTRRADPPCSASPASFQNRRLRRARQLMDHRARSTLPGPQLQQKQSRGALFAIDLFTRKSAALLGPLSRTPFVAGQVFTAADISCGYAVGLARFLGCEERLDPVVRDYAARLADRPAFRRALSKGQPSTS